jgi:hypothetical protein
VIRHVGGYVGVLVGGRQFMLTPEEAKGLAKFLLHEAEQQAMDEAARQAATKSIQVNEEPLGEVGRCSCGGIFYELDELLNHVCIGHPMADDPWYAGNAPADAIQPEEQRQ